MSELLDNIARVRERIGEAAAKAGRGASDILLIGATKTVDAETVARALPHLDGVGENRVQELVAKREAGAYRGGQVHFIGHLQTNKVSRVAGQAELIQSVGSLRLARAISAEMEKRGGIQDVLAEINIGAEASKSGLLSEEVFDVLPEMAALPGLRVRGIMAIPPAEGDFRKYFVRLRQLFIDINGKKYDNVFMDFLSMGMSGDFYEAVLEGSNMVRVGTAIFGSRLYPVQGGI